VSDFVVDASGELVLSKGDFSLTTNSAEEAKQDLLFRLQTSLFDYQPNPEIGVGLDRFVGQPNVRDTGEDIKSEIVRKLTRDPLFGADSIRVDVVPLSAHEVGVYIFYVPRISNNFESVTVAVTLDLIAGTITEITG
jgi:hypothetical protein